MKMQKYYYLAAVLALLLCAVSCSKEETPMNHDLDNTVWLKEKTLVDDQRDYILGLIFVDGYMLSVKFDKVNGNVSDMESRLQYSHDKKEGKIHLFNPTSGFSTSLSFKKGFIIWGAYAYYLSGKRP